MPATTATCSSASRTRLGEDAYQTALAEGASMELEAAASWVTRARGRRGRPLAGWVSLTPTAAKVANLVVEGLTNAQIGEQLLIGTGTVKTHLAHVFNKLKLASRAQLAAAVTANPRRDLTVRTQATLAKPSNPELGPRRHVVTPCASWSHR